MAKEPVTLASGETIDPPGRFNVDRLLRDVDALVRTLQRYRGIAIDMDVARAIAARANTHFDEALNFNYAFETIHQYNTKILDDEFIQLLVLQLVARREELASGPLALFDKPIKKEWVALELTDIQETTWRENDRGSLLKLFAFSGHPAGHRLTKKVPERWLNYLAYQVGFSRNRRYEDLPWTLIGTRFWGYLVPDEKADVLNFTAWYVTPPFLKMNREVIAFRTRHNQNAGIDKPACPHEHDWDCDQCHRKEDECPGSLHRHWRT